MMVVCQSRSIRLRIIHEDKTVTTLHYASRKERDSDKAFYEAAGFKCK